MADTIAAISTFPAVSAIGVVRISGDDALNVAEKVFVPDFGIGLHNFKNRKLYLGSLVDENGDILDKCLCTVSRAPNTYTGENTAELQCHGSPVVLAKALEALFKAGARQALAGEFTKRAFLNGRMDLIQAEAVVDLIDAETEAHAKNAASQLGRAVSRKTDAIYAQLVDIMSHFHAVIDYPDDDIEEFELRNYIDTLNGAERELSDLSDTFDRGKFMREGVKCAIIGRPNVGKSSLLNALVGYDRAIVTDIAGTTRDVIEEKVRIGDLILRLEDTAGMRDTSDTVEKLGVKKALETAKDADLVLAVFDGSDTVTDEDRAVLNALTGCGRAIAVINKSDLEQRLKIGEIESSVPCVCIISAETGNGISALCGKIKSLFSGGDKVPAGEIITNARQLECISRALNAVRDTKTAMESGVTPDAVLTCVEDAISALGELTGKNMREDIVARIFERFCVGK